VEENENISIHAKIKQWIKRRMVLVVVTVLIFAIALAIYWPRIVITIESGEAGILFKRFTGTKIDKIYEEGLHIFSPLDKLYIYEIRKQVAFHDFDVISNKGLIIHLSLAIRYRPEYELLGVLHQQIGPDYLNRVILPQIESVMRKQLGDYTAEQIYTNEAGLLTNAILTALDEVGRNYVEVEDIIIRSIRLPDKIVFAIENKLEQEEFMKSYEFRIDTAKKEAQRQKIEAGGIATYHNLINKSLTPAILQNKGIEATESIAKSNNTKVVIVGGGKDGLPIILNTDSAASSAGNTTADSNQSASTVIPSANAGQTPDNATGKQSAAISYE